MTDFRRWRPQPGDVFEIPTAKGLAYAQYSHECERLGTLVRVIPGFLARRPTDFSFIGRRPDVAFFRVIPVSVVGWRRLAARVSNQPIPEDIRAFPKLRAVVGRRADAPLEQTRWRVFDGEEYGPPQALNEEIERLSETGTPTWDDFVRQVEDEWRPERAELVLAVKAA